MERARFWKKENEVDHDDRHGDDNADPDVGGDGHDGRR
jgi:hypothetical protein